MATLIQPEASNITEPTQFVASRLETYAYRRFGRGSAPPLLGLQHFTGTLDFWDPAVTDPIARGREVILFENAGLGRSSGEVPDTMAGMAAHVLAFVDALGLIQVDVLGFSLGGVLAQLIALDRPSLVRKMLLVGTAPEGGEDIMHLEKPELKRILDDPNADERMQLRATLIRQPCLVVNGVLDQMISIRNSYALAEHLPRAMLLTYPDAGHGSLFQYHDSFVRQTSLFLDSETL